MKRYRLKPQVKNTLAVLTFYSVLIISTLLMIYTNK